MKLKHKWFICTSAGVWPYD